MDKIAGILGAQCRGDIDTTQAVAGLMKECTAEDLAEFIVDAKNRGWISNFNLGLDDEGKRM